MANSLSASFPEYWSSRMQVTFLKKAVYKNIASFEEQATLAKGDTVHRPYRSAMTVNTLGSEGSYTRQDITDTDETLVINQEKEVSFYVRDIDKMQSNYDTVNEYADEAGTRLSLKIDGDVLGEYDQAASIVDDAAFGGTTGNGVQMTTSNIQQIFSTAGRKLDRQEIHDGERWAVISPEMYQVILDYLGGKESALGDTTGTNGHVGKFGGFQLYKSTATGWSAQLELPTIPTAGDTITINGVVLTAAADNSATNAGDFSIEAAVDDAAANLVLLINGTGTPGADEYIDVSAANRKLLKDITATYNSSTNMLTLKAEGRGFVAVSETLTPAGDIWTPALQIQHNLFGQGKATDLVVQKKPNTQVFHRDGYVGDDIVSYTVYGLKTFTEGTKRLVDVKVRSDGF